MRSQLAVRLGAQEPQIVHLPPDVHSLAAAEEAIELADAYGLCDGHPLDESQRFTLRAGMGERVDGSWAAAQVGDFKGRQGGGKSDTVAARELAGLILVREPLIIHTAHEFATANESFLRLVALFENYDDLRRRVRRILYGNGTQSINLLSGQRILYKARTGSAGRGFTKAALVVYDEAQHLMHEHVAASGPARLAYPNSQSWYAGSGGMTTSKMAWRLRRRALSGAGGRLAYVEGTAQVVSLDDDGRIISSAPDPSDRDGWAMANPGLGRWVTEEAMADLYDELGPELFARECECVWEPEPSQDDGATWQVIDQTQWGDCQDSTYAVDGLLGWALDVSPGSRSAAIVCSDGTGAEVIEHRAGTDWVIARLLELRAKHDFGELALDANGPAGALLNDLDEAGIEVRKVTITEHAQACGDLLANIDQATFRHIGQDPLTTAAASAARRTIVDVWLWTRSKSGGDICPLVAATLARWFAKTLRDDEEADFFTI